MISVRDAQLKAFGSKPCAACQPAADASSSGAAGRSAGGGLPGARRNGPSVVVISKDQTAWIMVELVDEQGVPVPGEPFRITGPDGLATYGSLDNRGAVRLEGIAPGEYHVAFPERDIDGWQRAGNTEARPT